MATNNGAGHLSPLRSRFPELSPLEVFYDWFGFRFWDTASGAASADTARGLVDGEDYDSQAHQVEILGFTFHCIGGVCGIY